MRTTIDIPDDLFRRSKTAAAREGVSLRELVVRSLRSSLQGPARVTYRLRWRVSKGAQLVPDDVMASRDRLNDWLEQPDEPRDSD